MLIVNVIHNDTLVPKLASPLVSLHRVGEVYELLMSVNISSETFAVFWKLWLLEGRPSFFIRTRRECVLNLLAQLFCKEKPENTSLIPSQCPDTMRQRDPS